MSRRGNCYDNAVAESFFSSLKKERVKQKIYSTGGNGNADNFGYIEIFYNPQGKPTHLNPMSQFVVGGIVNSLNERVL